jgi:hypothetical protein
MDTSKKTDHGKSGKQRSRHKGGSSTSSQTQHQGIRNERKLDRASMAPLGDAAGQRGQIRADLGRAGLLGGRHNLGPQATSEVAQVWSARHERPVDTETSAGYDGFSGETLISGPTARDIEKERKRRHDELIRTLARVAAKAQRRLPGYEYNPVASLEQLREFAADPRLQEAVAAEESERNRRSGVNLPRGEEPASEAAGRIVRIYRLIDARVQQAVGDAMNKALKALTDAALEVAVEANLMRPEPERLSDRELARRFDTNPMRVGRLRKEITGRV